MFDKIKGQQVQFDSEITDLQKVVNESIDKQDGLNSDIQKIVDYYNKQRESIEDLVIETNKKTFANNQNIDQICTSPPLLSLVQQGNLHSTFEDTHLTGNKQKSVSKL